MNSTLLYIFFIIIIFSFYEIQKVSQCFHRNNPLEKKNFSTDKADFFNSKVYS